MSPYAYSNSFDKGIISRDKAYAGCPFRIKNRKASSVPVSFFSKLPVKTE